MDNLRLPFGAHYDRAENQPFRSAALVYGANLVQPWVARFIDVCYVAVVHVFARLSTDMSKSQASQTDKFKEAARAAECDEDEGRWEERLRKVARQKPGSGEKADQAA